MLHNTFDLVELIKKIAVNAVEAGKPADFCYGTVTSTSPLKIMIAQKLTLGSTQLVLTRNVTNFKAKINGEEITIENALKIGEKVVLVRQKGGQKFLVLDRVVNA